MSKMNPDIKARWVSFLRKQSDKAKLVMFDDKNYCTIGGLVEFYRQEIAGSWDRMSSIIDKTGWRIYSQTIRVLSGLSDENWPRLSY